MDPEQAEEEPSTGSRGVLARRRERARRFTLILAEDNADIRRQFTKLLSARYEVVVAVDDGEKLVEAASLLKPDVLLIDISMPGLGGLEALQLLRRRKVDTKAVVVSISSDPAYVRRAFELGASGYVWKVLAAEDLKPALAAALEGRTFVSRGIDAPHAGAAAGNE